MEEVTLAAKNFFTALGVDLSPPKSIFFNDREGRLIVRATLQDLDTIDAAIQVLNASPPQVNIKAKFVEVSQEDAKALGFDWYLGNVLMNNGAIGGQGGSAPSFNFHPGFNFTPANPEGTFPGSVPGGTSLPVSPTDQKVTGGLRNVDQTLFTLTGILTNPQFRMVLHALEQRNGADILSSPEVTIISGRQAQMKAVEIQTIVTDFDFNQQVGGLGGGGAAGGGTLGR
jgi:general secretion pathway protein D